MPAPLVERDDELDDCLRRALWAEPYPTPVQRTQARDALMTRAARQTMLPPATPRASLFARALCCTAALRAEAGRLLRGLLIDDNAYRRAQEGDFGRAAGFQRSPYVHFQPMW